jgi:serine/threonine protein kinase
MEPERLHQIQAIYSEAAALPPSERRDFLDQACESDTDLRTQVESLLAYGEDHTTPLDMPALQFAAESLAEEGAQLLVGRTLGRYQLLSLAGRGGMGDVYCGVDLQLNRLVAIKILPPYLADDPEQFGRFQQEARTIAAMSHPHICVLYDAGRVGSTSYLVFEYLTGELLSERLQRGPLPIIEALNYLIQIADALEHAHEVGVIHHDLTPQNIMVTSRGVKLLDFGLAELHYPAWSGPDTPAGLRATAGTPAYMAPEQVTGDRTDSRTDIYSFGVLASEMIAGCGKGEPKLAALQSVTTRCLARAPQERWQSISEALEKLRALAL